MRTAEARFALSLPSETRCTLLVLPAKDYASDDDVAVTVDGAPIAWSIEAGEHGTRQLLCTAPAGLLEVAVTSRVGTSQPSPTTEDPGRYRADSRYVEASALHGFIDERFGRATGFEQLEAMRHWIARGFTYAPSLSTIDDSALTTMRKSGGMCRDYAHVMIALARAAGFPARYVGVYAPGLVPPDFHAVAEVFVDGAWWVFDATGLAPRGSLIRIATGADALDTAWATTTGLPVTLQRLEVVATDDELADGAVDDARERLAIR